MKSYGVLQIEPTDFCNLRCVMCAPQLKNLRTLHGELPKGYMDLGLYQKVIDDLRASPIHFDHLIFQWLGDPALHPHLPEMVAYASEHVRDRFNYFRIDTNGIALTPARIDALMDVYRRAPEHPLLIVWSLDAATPATWAKVKGGPEYAMARVMEHVEHFITRRAGLDLPQVNLNMEFQFVLQEGNAHEALDFVQRWDTHLSEGRNGAGYNSLMIKRLSVGAGAAGQEEADRLYERTLERFSIRPFKKPHLELKIWERRPWQNTAAPARGSGRPPSSATTGS